jgi:protein-export membrane protein SecD
MLHFARWKMYSIIAVCLFGLIFSFPNLFAAESVRAWPNWLPKQQLSLGLDLRGGSHMVLELDINEMKKAWADALLDETRRRLRVEAKVAFSNLSAAGNRIQVRIDKPEDMDKAIAELRKMGQTISGIGFGGMGGSDLEFRREGDQIIIEPTEAGMRQRIDAGMSTAIETLRRRVDALGTTEPIIVREGQGRIVVQVPGLKDPAQLREIIGKTAKLTFQFVHSDYSPRGQLTREETRSIQVPAGSVLLPSDEGKDLFEVIERRVIVSGEELVDAQPGFDSRNNEPVVNFRFNQSGARKFGKATQENVNRRFAIVLDGKVISAPSIREPILGGSGQISGRFTVQTANALAILLRSGALPATMTIIEERSVGPSLGEDSIRAGKIAAYIGYGLVAVFMMAAYGLFGLFAVVALVLNLALLIGIITAMQSTLTLPGIAGIVLTMGMAVDANVLVYERIREELRNGKTAISAIDSGFSRAMGTIIDSQLTTFIAGVLMFWLGSGPIRGFGITLTLGLITSVFTAVIVTRLIIAVWLRWQRASRSDIVVPV